VVVKHAKKDLGHLTTELLYLANTLHFARASENSNINSACYRFSRMSQCHVVSISVSSNLINAWWLHEAVKKASVG
jgi:hypothetical protein